MLTSAGAGCREASASGWKHRLHLIERAPHLVVGDMTRGNQREVDRQRAQARNAKTVTNKDKDGLTAAARKERDAKALQEKQAKKAAAAAGNNGAQK
ncbi:hypothetical protein WJX74_009025 [Apatococcus lobatus]|uniref:Small EDRK-rich factor-like N-terminal domain-containing protein n=1 Tax=Apatococcus lobatus TaxID=904363 RepID=A0AAW1R3U3_9CHLO